MKRKFLFAVIAALGLASGAEARDYFGVRFGFPELGVQLGSTDLISRNLGGRLTVDFGYYVNGVVLGGDILYTLVLPTPGSSFDLDVYFGGGVGFGFSNGSRLGWNVHGVLGLDFLVTRDLAIFAEVRPLGYADYGYYYGGSLGLNFRL